jgi:hypothetical protein
MTIVPPNPALPHPQADSAQLSDAIRRVVADFDAKPNDLHSMSILAKKYQIKHRRLYDAINVFSALGCATRVGTDQVRWNGRDASRAKLRAEMTRIEIDSADKPLGALFPPETVITLASLSIALVLLFPALQVEIIDLREASCFFSRERGQYKTTLSKLYQIVSFVTAVDIIERAENVCEVKLTTHFTDITQQSPLAIAQLLNRTKYADTIGQRQDEYQQHWEGRFKK